MSDRIVLAWSGGKDSTLTLEALQAGGWEVAGLLTTVTRGVDRISMHGVRRALLHQQAAALGLEVREVWLSQQSSNDEYDEQMAAAMAELRADGVAHVAFGDLFLRDVRAYREERLAGSGVEPVFPVWGRDTRAFVDDFVARGYRAVVVCVDTDALPPAFAGRAVDERFFEDLPDDVDPAGENGEFHTFVWDGPTFSAPVAFTLGEQVTRRERFRYQDLVPT